MPRLAIVVVSAVALAGCAAVPDLTFVDDPDSSEARRQADASSPSAQSDSSVNEDAAVPAPPAPTGTDAGSPARPEAAADAGEHEAGVAFECGAGAACHCGPGADGVAVCTEDCTGGAQCGPMVCGSGDTCTVTCTGDSQCEKIDCREALSCSVKCTGGSEALLLCSGAGSCAFAECSGGQGKGAGGGGGGGARACPNGVIVCNRPCP